jgi:predicted phage gp36 major capsid-like protein
MEVIETLEAAAPGELGSTLDALLASLDDDTSQRTAVDLLDAALVPVSPSPAPDVAAPAVPEAFDRFWQTVEHGRISARDDRARGLISTRVMLPATGVVAAIAVVMAWLG